MVCGIPSRFHNAGREVKYVLLKRASRPRKGIHTSMSFAIHALNTGMRIMRLAHFYSTGDLIRRVNRILLY